MPFRLLTERRHGKPVAQPRRSQDLKTSRAEVLAAQPPALQLGVRQPGQILIDRRSDISIAPGPDPCSTADQPDARADCSAGLTDEVWGRC